MLLVDDLTLQTPAEMRRNQNSIFMDSSKCDISWYFVETKDKPLFLDDELPEASLVGPAVV